MSSTVVNDGTAEFVSSVVINSAIGLICVVGFSFVRRRFPWLYDVRRIDNIRNPNYRPGEFYLARPPRQAKGFFAWIKQVYYFSDDDIAATAGLDAVMSLRFIRWFLLYFSLCTLIAVVIIIPVQVTAHVEGVAGLTGLSLSSIPNGSTRLVTHLLMAYTFTFLLFFILVRLWQGNISLQARWLSNEQFAGRRLTIMVEHVPKHLCTDQALLQFFESIFPGKVAGAALLKDVPELRSASLERDHWASEVVHHCGAMATDFAGDHARPMYQTKCCGDEQTQVDAIDRALELYRDADERVHSLGQGELRNRAVGFVAFNSAVAAAAAVALPLTASAHLFTSKWAPEPREVLWAGMLMRPAWKTFLAAVMHVAHFFLVFFYIVPVSFVSSLMTLEALSERLSFLGDVNNLPDAVKGFLQGFLPALALTIFMALLPKILAAMGQLQGLESTAWVEMYVFKKYYVFQLFNFFLVTLFASSVLEQIDNIISNPTDIPRVLAESLPSSASLYINYVMLRALYTNLFDLFDIARIILGNVFLMLASAPEEHAAAYNPDPFKYGKVLPEALLIITVGYCFATIQPIILPFVALYCGTFLLTHKYQFCYLHVTSFEAGGAFWPLMFNRLILGVVISQLCLLGLFGLKSAPVEAALMVPLVLLTILFWFLCDGVFAKKMSMPHLNNAVLVDRARANISADESAAMQDGHELAALGEDLVPFLMPDKYADCIAHDHYVRREFYKQQQAREEKGASVEDAESPVQESSRRPVIGQSLDPDAGLLFHYDEDGHVYSADTMRIMGRPLSADGDTGNPYWKVHVPTDVAADTASALEAGEAPPSAVAIAASKAVSVSNRLAQLPFADVIMRSSSEVVVNERGLTAEQEAVLAGTLYRRMKAREIASKQRANTAASRAGLAGDGSRRASVTGSNLGSATLSVRGSRCTSRDTADAAAVRALAGEGTLTIALSAAAHTATASLPSPSSPSSPQPARGVYGGAGDLRLMQKYTQQELAPERYAVRVTTHVWADEYVEYRRAQWLAKGGKLNKAARAKRALQEQELGALGSVGTTAPRDAEAAAATPTAHSAGAGESESAIEASGQVAGEDVVVDVPVDPTAAPMPSAITQPQEHERSQEQEEDGDTTALQTMRTSASSFSVVPAARAEDVDAVVAAEPVPAPVDVDVASDAVSESETVPSARNIDTRNTPSEQHE